MTAATLGIGLCLGVGSLLALAFLRSAQRTDARLGLVYVPKPFNAERTVEDLVAKAEAGEPASYRDLDRTMSLHMLESPADPLDEPWCATYQDIATQHATLGEAGRSLFARVSAGSHRSRSRSAS